MKLQLVFVSVFLILCEGRAPRTTTTTTTPTTTTRATRTTRTTGTTTTTALHYTIDSGGPGVNLRGKMFTLSQGSRVTFFPPNYFPSTTTTTAPKPRTKSTPAPPTTTTATTTSTTTTSPPTTTTTTTTAKSTTTTAPPTTTTTTTTAKSTTTTAPPTTTTTTTTAKSTTTTAPPTTTTTTTTAKSTTTTAPPTTTTTTTTAKSTTTTTPVTTTTTTTPVTTTTTTTAVTRTTTLPTMTTAPVTPGVSVCLRYLADRDSIDFFTLAPSSDDAITFSMVGRWYTLSSRGQYWTATPDGGVQVSLNPTIPLWSWAQTPPWTSLCVVLDSLRRVVQVFQTGSMSVRKILPSQMVWSGEPVLDVPGFPGQMTDLEVWNRPLKYEEIFSYMKSDGPGGTVLTWSNMAYRSRGDVLVEAAYDLHTSEEEERPIRKRGGRGHGRDRQSGYKSMFSGWRQRKILI